MTPGRCGICRLPTIIRNGTISGGAVHGSCYRRVNNNQRKKKKR